MRRLLTLVILAGSLVPAMPAVATPAKHLHRPAGLVPDRDISHRPSDYSNGYGTNAGNSEAVGAPVGPYGGYVVNQYGFGNYVSGPQGYGGYPAGSDGAQIWRQRQQWKCQNVPESC